jgi:hypothetical protein
LSPGACSFSSRIPRRLYGLLAVRFRENECHPRHIAEADGSKLVGVPQLRVIMPRRRDSPPARSKGCDLVPQRTNVPGTEGGRMGLLHAEVPRA